MNEYPLHDTHVCYDPTQVLSSDDEFCQWFLALHDLSMFSESEISALIEDIKPGFYPCIPLMSDKGFDVIYAGVSQVASWFDTINEPKDVGQS